MISMFHVMVQDHIERENIDLSQLKFSVLDEADEMLRMGFVEDVELIIGVSFLFICSQCLGYCYSVKFCSNYVLNSL